MSLFEDNHYQFRDTFFVLFEDHGRPDSNRIRNCLAELGNRYEVSEVQESDGQFEAVTVKSPYDFSAMDIVYVAGDEVSGQVKELLETFRTMTLSGDEASKIQRLKKCNARFDVYHFEESHSDGPDNGDEFMDPGGLLLVIEKLTELSNGVSVDPQSMTLL